MKKAIVVSAVAVGAMVLAGCATITRGTRQPLYFTGAKEAPAVKVTLSDGQNCALPCTLRVKRKADLEATISAEGFKSATVQIPHSNTGTVALLGNVVIGGVVGIVIDLTNDSLYGHKSNAFRIKLVPTSSADNSSVETIKASKAKKELSAK